MRTVRIRFARWLAVGLAWLALFGGALPARAETSPNEQEIACVVPRERAPSVARRAPFAAPTPTKSRRPGPARPIPRERVAWRSTPLFLSHRALLR